MTGFAQIRRGILDHLRAARLTLMEFAAYVVVIILADKATGIWRGSAKALAVEVCVSERQARHLLESLERKSYVKRFATRRKRGNYPVLVARYEVTFGAYKGMRLNAERTTDWRNPVYESRLEDGLEDGVEQGVRKGLEKGVESAPFLEVEGERERKRENADTAPSAPGECDLVVATWEAERGTLPKAKLTRERRRKIITLLRADPDFLLKFTAAVRKAQESAFLCGGGEKGWVADFDWFVKNGTNYVKVLEGSYDNRNENGHKNGNGNLSVAERRSRENAANLEGVLGPFEKQSSDPRRTLPPADL